jgi:alkaline phosphatase
MVQLEVNNSRIFYYYYLCGYKKLKLKIKIIKKVDPNANPCGTLLEAAKHQREMLTGLVVTSRVTHATPAAFSAHVTDRNDETNIALQQIGENPLGRTVDLLFGGGSCQFLPECREDGRNLLNEAKEKYNWTTVLYHDRQGFDNLKAEPGVLPAISVFSADVSILNIFFKKTF